MKQIKITEENKYLLNALANCPIGTEITFNDGVIEVGKHEFKRGDFLTSNDGDDILIFKVKSITMESDSFCSFFNIQDRDNFAWTTSKFRHSTEEEKQRLIKALNDQGKDWDAEKMEIVDYIWKPKIGDVIYYIDADNDDFVLDFVFEGKYDLTAFDFRTKELAEEALDVLKNLKHY